MTEIIRISVRSLVEFILRSGDIDNRSGQGADKEAMQMGSRLHRKLQGRQGADYRAEVPLKREVDFETFVLSVEGRADGILENREGVTIDEIKGVFRDVVRMEEPEEVHLAQAKCYACMYGSQQHLREIGVRMTYANLETEELRYFHQKYSLEELEEWFAQITGAYRKWAQMQLDWRTKRNASISGTVFPYPWREGQKDLAASVYRTIWHGKKLFIQAPTGAGKTIAVVFPAVQAVGKGLGEKIFYLTAKTITRTVAQEAFSLLKENGLCYRVLTLTAKEKICFLKEPECNPQSCPYAKGHFDRVNDAIFELLTSGWSLYADGKTGRVMHAEASEAALQQEQLESGAENTGYGNYTRDCIRQQAEKWQVCPFEMALDLSLWSDAVICDYNYVFDPQARLKRFFAEGVKGDYLFLIDEAHNLVERGREMYSASLYKEDFLEAKRFLKPYSKKAAGALERCNRYLLEWKRECEDYLLLPNVDAFDLALLNVSAALEQLLENRESVLNAPSPDPELEEQRKKTLDFYFQVRAFLEIYEELDDSYEIYVQHMEDGRFRLRLFCIHTANRIGRCLEKGRASILFSATLLPVRYYMDLLAGKPEDYAVYAHSTFRPDHRKVLLGRDVSARYTRRTPEEYRKLAEYIRRLVQGRRGNYLIFFPSYKMLAEVKSVFVDACAAVEKNSLPGKAEDGMAEVKAGPEKIKILEQTARMTESDREEFLGQFRENRDETLVGFCVMGGIFGEGIDLKRDRLIGAAVIGPGLPQVCREREILKQYYDRRGMDGFAYAYRYPGMNKVMQAAGRVIRTDGDTGVILLLDDRFCQAEYRSCFPREWADCEVCTLQTVSGKLEEFWTNAPLSFGTDEMK